MKDTETEEHGTDSGTATEAVVSSGGAPAPVGKSGIRHSSLE